jgi:hypothetical protein
MLASTGSLRCAAASVPTLHLVMPLTDQTYGGKRTRHGKPEAYGAVMDEPSRSRPPPRDVLIAAFALLVLGVVGAAVVAWDTIRSMLRRPGPTPTRAT